MFFNKKSNYQLLKKIYDFLYINERIKDGENNNVKSIKGPLRDIYLKDRLSVIQKLIEKFEKRKGKKNDVWKKKF